MVTYIIAINATVTWYSEYFIHRFFFIASRHTKMQCLSYGGIYMYILLCTIAYRNVKLQINYNEDNYYR